MSLQVIITIVSGVFASLLAIAGVVEQIASLLDLFHPSGSPHAPLHDGQKVSTTSLLALSSSLATARPMVTWPQSWTRTRTDIALTPNMQAPETQTAFVGGANMGVGHQVDQGGLSILEYQLRSTLLITYEPKTPAATGSLISTAKETEASTKGTIATMPTAGITSLESTSPPRSTAAAPEPLQSTSSQAIPVTTGDISVGVMAGVIVIALFACLLYRKRQRQPAVQQHDPQYQPPATYSQQQYNAQPPYHQSRAELGTGGERYMPAKLQ
ncbi:hypothetical protein PG993_011549 [Apiospora rasikravindrae]|uniref:Mid2 domain-containing protein n=1 Tax=Apiospora rasikravindrae TaxID=990691 RepID=A0ABR1SEQ5_9PEZI